jgi:hypothetical protein
MAASPDTEVRTTWTVTVHTGEYAMVEMDDFRVYAGFKTKADALRLAWTKANKLVAACKRRAERGVELAFSETGHYEESDFGWAAKGCFRIHTEAHVVPEDKGYVCVAAAGFVEADAQSWWRQGATYVLDPDARLWRDDWKQHAAPVVADAAVVVVVAGVLRRLPPMLPLMLLLRLPAMERMVRLIV